jgi:hypothetical protein
MGEGWGLYGFVLVKLGVLGCWQKRSNETDFLKKRWALTFTQILVDEPIFWALTFMHKYWWMNQFFGL